MKMLYILNVANRVNNFCMSSLMAARIQNIEYHIAGNWAYKDDAERRADEQRYGIHIYHVDFIRSPISLKNITAYRQLKEIVARENFDVIHCNTPIGGVLGRLVSKKYKTKHVIYQVHGFHFYKGAPKLNWLVYYPIEKWLAHYTDTLITINQEDFDIAKRKFRLKNHGEICYAPGVGINLNQFGHTVVNVDEKRKEIGIPRNAVLLISVGELNENKNHETVIKAIKGMDVYYIIAGEGDKRDMLQALIDEQGMTDRVRLLGFRTDVQVLYAASDMFVFPSFREGLSVALMEAMASGLPCVVSQIRGNVDLIDNHGGMLFNPHDVNAVRDAILKVLSSDLRSMGEYNKQKIRGFSTDIVLRDMAEIYGAEASERGKQDDA